VRHSVAYACALLGRKATHATPLLRLATHGGKKCGLAHPAAATAQWRALAGFRSVGEPVCKGIVE